MILLCVCVRENSGRVGEVGLDRLTEQIICHWILIIACLVRCRANPGDEEDDAVGSRIRNNVIVGKPSCLLRLSLSLSLSLLHGVCFVRSSADELAALAVLEIIF